MIDHEILIVENLSEFNMFLPVFLLLFFIYFLFFMKKFKSKKISIKKFIVYIAIFPFLSFGDHAVSEISASVWVSHAVNQNICTRSWGRVFTIAVDYFSTDVCSPPIEKSHAYDNALESYFLAKQNQYIFSKNMDMMEIDSPISDKIYRIKRINNNKNNECFVAANEFINFFEKEISKKSQVTKNIDFIKTNCIDVVGIEKLSDEYVMQYAQEEVFFFKYPLYLKKYRRLTNSKTKQLIYEHRLTKSDGGFFAKIILVNPETGVFGRGFNFGSNNIE
jgi:hypothetical protein